MRSGGDALGASVHCTNSVEIHDAARDVREQLRRVEPPEHLFCDEQRLPDHRRRVLHLFETLGRGRPQPHRRERRLHRVRRPQMLPVLTRKLVEGHHPLPVAIERAPRLGVAALRAPGLERSLLPLGFLAGLGVRNLREQTPRCRLLLERQLIEHVQEAVVPAPLLLRLREYRGQRALRRPIEGADSGAPSPSSPRKARSKSPWARPCRYSSGSNRPTSSVRRLNAGSSRLSKRSLKPRTRGRRSVIVPLLKLSRRGWPKPLRYPSGASTAVRRS